MVRPSARRPRSSSASASLLHRAQAGRRLVENDHGRVGRERPGDLEHALAAERQVAGELMRHVAEADPPQLRHRLVARASLLGAVEPECAGEEPGPGARIGAEHHVVEHRHAAPQLDVLERPGDAGPGDPSLPRGRDIAAAESHAAAVGPGRAGDEIEHRALAGAVRSDQREDFARVEREADLIDGDQAAETLDHALGRKERGSALGIGAARQRRRIRDRLGGRSRQAAQRRTAQCRCGHAAGSR